MPLNKLQFRPGVNREGTTLSNEGGWFDCDKIRFRSGYPEKLGGWQVDTGTIGSPVPTGTFVAGGTATPATPTAGLGSFWGAAKSVWNWLNLTGYNLLSIGTNLKFYIQNSTGGFFNDITPVRLTTTAGTTTFAAVNGSPTITVTHTAHGAQRGDFVIFSSAASLGGAITAAVLNREYQVQSVTSNSTYTITAVATANASDTGNGGGATIANYQLTTGNSTFTFGVGYGAGGYGGSTGPAFITTLTAPITAGSTTPIAVVSTTGFPSSGTIYIDAEGITYTSTTATTFAGTITRGVNSTAAAHSSAALVSSYASTATGYGSPATTGIGIQIRLWNQDNYGEDLIFNQRGGPLYYWANNANPNVYDRGQIVKAATNIVTKAGTITPDATCPSTVNFVLVSDSSRFVFAFGCNDPTGVYATTAIDPMQIRWSDQSALGTWEPNITNQAGDIRLSHGSTIVTALQTRQEILVLTDAAIYGFQYIGAPYVWSSQLLADNISIVSPNAMAVVNNVTYWMGADKFYMYSGRVETLPCSLRDYIFSNLNTAQAFQFFSGTNEGFNEVWWFYVSISGTNADGTDGNGTPGTPNIFVDRYVIYNHLERIWYYGTFNGTTVRPRTCWMDSPLRSKPTATITHRTADGTGYGNSSVVYHETGVDNVETGTPLAIDSYVQSSDFDIGDGHNYGFVWRLIPDVSFSGSTAAAPSVDFTVRPRQNPGAAYGAADNPRVTGAQSYVTTVTYNVQQFTEQVYVRIRGRQMAFKVSNSTLGTQWGLGTPRIDIRPDGRK